MTVCAAKDCKNKSQKGVKMCNFPSDPDKRSKWVANVGRKNWVPNKHSALCEYHFVADAFEKERVDGTKKLKLHAIPTIFGELVTQIPNQRKKQKTDTECRSEKTSTATHCMQNDSSVPAREYQEFDSIDIFYEKPIPIKEQNTMISVLKPVDVIHKCTEENHYFQEETNTSAMIAVINTRTEENSYLEKERANASTLQRTCASNNNIEVTELITKCKKFEQLYELSEKSKIKMKRTYKQKEMALKRRIKTLEQQVGINEKLTNGFLTGFSTNQIRYACGQLKRMP